MVESLKIPHFAEEIRMGDQEIESNGHQRETGLMEVFRTLKDIQDGNGKILQCMEQQNQINQQMM